MGAAYSTKPTSNMSQSKVRIPYHRRTWVLGRRGAARCSPCGNPPARAAAQGAHADRSGRPACCPCPAPQFSPDQQADDVYLANCYQQRGVGQLAGGGARLPGTARKVLPGGQQQPLLPQVPSHLLDTGAGPLDHTGSMSKAAVRAGKSQIPALSMGANRSEGYMGSTAGLGLDQSLTARTAPQPSPGSLSQAQTQQHAGAATARAAAYSSGAAQAQQVQAAEAVPQPQQSPAQQQQQQQQQHAAPVAQQQQQQQQAVQASQQQRTTQSQSSVVETGPITPAQALKRYSEYLTPFEQSEVLQYQQVGVTNHTRGFGGGCWHGQRASCAKHVGASSRRVQLHAASIQLAYGKDSCQHACTCWCLRLCAS